MGDEQKRVLLAARPHIRLTQNDELLAALAWEGGGVFVTR